MKHEEYPKILYHPSHTYSVVVHNSDNEDNVKARWALDGDNAEDVKMDIFRDILLARALKAGIKVDSSWSNYRLEKELA